MLNINELDEEDIMEANAAVDIKIEQQNKGKKPKSPRKKGRRR